MRLTQAEVKNKLKALGISFRSRDGEFKVAGNIGEAVAYYTSDLEDALNTGRMLGQIIKLNQKADVYTARHGRLLPTAGTWTTSPIPGCVRFMQRGGTIFDIPASEIRDGHGQPIFA